jgi:hypothetical protein
MTQVVAKYAAKKLLNKEMSKYKDKGISSKYDPYYEEIPHPRKPGKTKKVKKQIPAYIPSEEAEILAYARRRAYKLDLCLFNFMGIRFGWSSVIGIVPAVGDVLDLAFALRLVWRMSTVKCGLETWTKILMLVNIAVDFLVGLIPFVGDLADAALKANSKNVRLLEERLDEVYKPKALKDQEENLPKAQRPAPATVYEDFSDEDDERRGYSPERNDRRGDITPPQPARIPTARKGEAAPPMSSNGRGWGRRERQPDVEMGIDRNGDTHRSGRNDTRSGRR